MHLQLWTCLSILMFTSGTNGSMEWRTAETSTMATESIHQTWYKTNAYHNASKMAQESKTKQLLPSWQIPKQTWRGPTRDRVVCTYTRFLGKLYIQSATYYHEHQNMSYGKPWQISLLNCFIRWKPLFHPNMHLSSAPLFPNCLNWVSLIKIIVLV